MTAIPPAPALDTLSLIGNTPLVQLQRIPGEGNARRGNVILGKLEGNNPAGSVKDRPALSMIKHAEARGRIKPGDTLIESTSGNTGIALAMAAAVRGYKMVLIMPEDLSVERRQSMAAYGAEIILTPVKGGMEYGATDDFCYNITENPVHLRDLHATILHCLGIDHARFTHRFRGLNARLTGVEEAHVVRAILA
jgi:cysteine synthase